MHPDISKLPSNLFYAGRLQDGPELATKTARPWHAHEKFGTYRFFNVTKGNEEQDGHSLKNPNEIEVALALYARLKTEFASRQEFRVGFVSMYKAQIMSLRRAYEAKYGRDVLGLVAFNTVDGFQGQEMDVIILSCVRAGPGVRSVGFLSGKLDVHWLTE
jgi:senataxin